MKKMDNLKVVKNSCFSQELYICSKDRGLSLQKDSTQNQGPIYLVYRSLSEFTRISSVFNIVKNTDSLKFFNEPYIMTQKIKDNNNNSFELQKQKIIQG